MSLLGRRCKFILESVFDWVAAEQVTYVKPDGTSVVLNAITHDEVLRNRREHLGVENAGGIVDRDSKRYIFKTADITGLVGGRLDPAGFMFIGGFKFDFSVSEPFMSDDITPIAGASNTYTVVYVRRAIELHQSKEIPAGDRSYGFDGWTMPT